MCKCIDSFEIYIYNNENSFKGSKNKSIGTG
jgi:hypothetical protein